MSLAVGAACVVALVAAGWWPMRAWAADIAGPGLVGRLSVACALGAAVTGLVQVALSAAGWPAGAAVPAVLAALSLLAVRARPNRGPTDGSTGASARGETLGPARRVLSLPLAGLLLVVALVSTGAAIGLPFRGDGSKFWATRARELSDSDASRAPSLHDPDRLGVHRNYPVLVPVLLAPVFGLSPTDAATGPKLVLAALNLSLVGLLASLLARSGPGGRLLLPVVVTLPFLVGVDVRESAVSGGYVDSADALFLLLVVAGVERLRGTTAARSQASGAGSPVTLAVVCGAALLGTKLEGGVELLLVAMAWLLTGPARSRIVPWLGLAAVLALPTFLVRLGVAADEAGFLPGRLGDPATLAARLPPVLAGLGGLLLDVSCFGLLPPLLLLRLLPRAGNGRRATRTFALWLLAGAAGFLLLSYLTTNMHAGRHIHTSAHRLAWHWLPALTWLVARVTDGDDDPAAAAVRPGGSAAEAASAPARAP